MFWLGIWCESLVWVIMGRRGVSQNVGILVVLVGTADILGHDTAALVLTERYEGFHEMFDFEYIFVDIKMTDKTSWNLTALQDLRAYFSSHYEKCTYSYLWKPLKSYYWVRILSVALLTWQIAFLSDYMLSYFETHTHSKNCTLYWTKTVWQHFADGIVKCIPLIESEILISKFHQIVFWWAQLTISQHWLK